MQTLCVSVQESVLGLKFCVLSGIQRHSHLDRVNICVWFDRVCKMLDQVYGEAWLTSMVKVRCQDHEPGLGLGLGFWKAVGAGYWYV